MGHLPSFALSLPLLLGGGAGGLAPASQGTGKTHLTHMHLLAAFCAILGSGGRAEGEAAHALPSTHLLKEKSGHDIL